MRHSPTAVTEEARRSATWTPVESCPLSSRDIGIAPTRIGLELASHRRRLSCAAAALVFCWPLCLATRAGSARPFSSRASRGSAEHSQSAVENHRRINAGTGLGCADQPPPLSPKGRGPPGAVQGALANRGHPWRTPIPLAIARVRNRCPGHLRRRPGRAKRWPRRRRQISSRAT